MTLIAQHMKPRTSANSSDLMYVSAVNSIVEVSCISVSLSSTNALPTGANSFTLSLSCEQTHSSSHHCRAKHHIYIEVSHAFCI